MKNFLKSTILKLRNPYIFMATMSSCFIILQQLGISISAEKSKVILDSICSILLLLGIFATDTNPPEVKP